MNATPSLRRIVIGCCGLIAILSTGCARWIELMAPPNDTPEHSSQTITRDEQVPLVMDRIRMTLNGSPQNPSADTEQRMLGSLADIGLFLHLGGTASAEPPANEKVVRARLLFDESIDPHASDAAWKGIVIGASMFILTPFIPLEYDYAAHVTLELERWDGQIKRYESQSAGTAHYHLFAATPIMIDELKGHVTESCLTALAQQLVNDTTFYSASSAPIAEPGIRTVSVKSQSPDLPTSSPSVIPVSAPAEP
jgi:hypothetical protein